MEWPHAINRLNEEALTNPTTSSTQHELFVQALTEQMAKLAETVSLWVSSEPRTLGAMEQQIMRGFKDLGASMLTGLCHLRTASYPAATIRCACGQAAAFVRRRPATIKTVLGTITVVRP